MLQYHKHLKNNLTYTTSPEEEIGVIHNSYDVCGVNKPLRFMFPSNVTRLLCNSQWYYMKQECLSVEGVLSV